MNLHRFHLFVRKTSQNLSRAPGVACTFALAIIIVVAVPGRQSDAADTPTRNASDKVNDVLELNSKQVAGLKIEPAMTAEFQSMAFAYGAVDFNENLQVPVFSNYQGRILQAYAEVGDPVRIGQPLFTVNSPDLASAESTLLSARAVFDLSSKVLKRARELIETRAISVKELEQNISDQTAAEAALKSARLAVRVFGKSDAEIAQIENQRKIDATLVIASPVDGQVITRNAQPGLLVQPGTTPAPFMVADVSKKWLVINASEAESTRLRVGQAVEVRVPALAQESFVAKIRVIGSVVDPTTRTVMVRTEVSDPKQVLRSGMYATYTILGEDRVKSVAVPLDALVREGDGTMSVWVVTGERRMVRRTVKTGIRTSRLAQITEGLQEGELIASTGAIFLSNLLATGE